MRPGGPPQRRWLRAAALLAVTLTLSTRPLIIIALPFVVLTIVGHGRRTGLLLAASVMAALLLTGASPSGAWYLDRGWALILSGWFVLFTLRAPGTGFFGRALGALAGAFAAGAVFFLVQPGGWSVADWSVTSRIADGVTTAIELVRITQGDAAVSPALVAAAYQAARVQSLVFPAMLGLSSLAGLGVAWWVYVRLVHGSDAGLGPFREFRFNDQLVWVMVAGVAVLVLSPGDSWQRLGTNTVVFMGALYALRGAAVAAFLGGGLSVLGGVVLGLVLIFMWPVVLPGAVLLGLGDTWLDVRARARALLS